MAEEKFTQEITDDQSVINFLLKEVRGLAIVSTPPLAEVEADVESSATDF